MPQGNTTIITATTDAIASAAFLVMDSHPVTLVAWGLSGTTDDTDLAVQITYDGTNFVNCFKDGSQVLITSVNNPITVYGPGVFRINKGATSGTVGVAKWKKP